MPQLHYSLWLAPLLIAAILYGIGRLLGARTLNAIYREKFPETPRERLFWASLGFLVALAVVRTLTFLIHSQIGPFHDIEMRGRHIHHLVWGILLLLVTGYGWLLEAGTGARGSRTWAGRAMSAAYGVGAALTLRRVCALAQPARCLLGARRPRQLRGAGPIRRRAGYRGAGGPFLPGRGPEVDRQMTGWGML